MKAGHSNSKLAFLIYGAIRVSFVPNPLVTVLLVIQTSSQSDVMKRSHEDERHHYVWWWMLASGYNEND